MADSPRLARADVLERERELVRAQDELAELEAEAEALAAAPEAQGHADGGAYRTVDPVLRREQTRLALTEEALHAVDTARANLAIEEAIVATRAEDRSLARKRRPIPGGFVVLPAALAALVSWYFFENFGLTAFSVFLAGFGWWLVKAMDALKPNPPRPPFR
jgi:hypothetical protein